MLREIRVWLEKPSILIRIALSSDAARLVVKTLDKIDRFINLKSFYIIVNNTLYPYLQKGRVYKCAYVLPCPEHKLRRTLFGDKKDMELRIAESCSKIILDHIQAFIQHSIEIIEKALMGCSLDTL